MQIPSRFTHDVVRMGDRVYVCDTGNGQLLELEFPSMTLVGGEGWGGGAPSGGGSHALHHNRV